MNIFSIKLCNGSLFFNIVIIKLIVNILLSFHLIGRSRIQCVLWCVLTVGVCALVHLPRLPQSQAQIIWFLAFLIWRLLIHFLIQALYFILALTPTLIQFLNVFGLVASLIFLPVTLTLSLFALLKCSIDQRSTSQMSMACLGLS